MVHIARLAYGVLGYAVFLFAILYAVGFVANLAVPKSIDSGPVGNVWVSTAVNIALLSIFALQHSIMARKSFKAWVHRFLPPAIERSTYVLAASLVLLLIFWQWRPLPQLIWSFEHPIVVSVLLVLMSLGWMLVLLSTFLINHFELFGLQQVISDAIGASPAPPRFRTPLIYKVVRHPIYLGFIIAFWATPVMSLGHALFAAVTTAYILVGIRLEERDLVHVFGEQYLAYRNKVAMLVPGMRLR